MINLTLTHKIFRKSKRKQIKAKLQIKKKTTNEENDKDEKTKPNMCKSSSSSEIRLRGRYVAAVVDEREYITLLKNKLPLTKPKKIEYGLPLTTTLKFHYESADLLLEDYLEYMQNFQDRKEKSFLQYILDIKDVWNSVDKSMCLFPNGHKEHEMIESSFFLPQKRRLIENKGKEPHEQDCHIEAKTIKSKLDSVIRLLKFLEDRSIFAGFSKTELNASKQFLREFRTGLKDLIIERATQMKEHKSKIFLPPAFLKGYGSSDHVKEIHAFLDSLTNKPQSTEIKP